MRAPNTTDFFLASVVLATDKYGKQLPRSAAAVAAAAAADYQVPQIFRLPSAARRARNQTAALISQIGGAANQI